jgi:hypothetical protein
MPIEVAGRIFVAMTLILLILGTRSLHRVLWGRVGLWPACAILFLYNDAFYWGLLNYLFALGVALLGFSGWLATRRWPPARRLPIFALVAGLLFVLHLFAFGVYGLLVVSCEIGTVLQEDGRKSAALRRAASSLLQFIPAALLWLATLSHGGPRYTTYGGVFDKLMALTAPMVYGDVGLVALPLCLGLIFIGWRSRTLSVAPAMRLPIIVLLIAAAAMPNWLLGSWAADVRLPVALAFIGIASLKLDVPRRVGVALAVFALLFLCARVYALTQSWRDMDDHFAEFRRAAAGLPDGARLLIVQSPFADGGRAVAGVPEILMARQSPDFFHMAALSVIDRGAFVPYLFTGWTTIQPTARNVGRYRSQGVPLRPEELVAGAAPDGREMDMEPNQLGEAPYWRDWPAKFDFVLWLDFGRPAVIAPRLELWRQGSFFHVYRIAAPAGGTQ